MDQFEVLRQYSVQQLQLELIRRFVGRRVQGNQLVHFLLEQQTLWEGVILNEIDFIPSLKLRPLPSLIKLGALPTNQWYARSLYLVTSSEEHAEQLQRLGVEQGLWHDDAVFLFDKHSSETILGMWRIEQRVMIIGLE
jgi:hypothetical protein